MDLLLKEFFQVYIPLDACANLICPEEVVQIVGYLRVNSHCAVAV